MASDADFRQFANTTKVNELVANFQRDLRGAWSTFKKLVLSKDAVTVSARQSFPEPIKYQFPEIQAGTQPARRVIPVQSVVSGGCRDVRERGGTTSWRDASCSPDPDAGPPADLAFQHKECAPERTLRG